MSELNKFALEIFGKDCTDRSKRFWKESSDAWVKGNNHTAKVIEGRAMEAEHCAEMVASFLRNYDTNHG